MIQRTVFCFPTTEGYRFTPDLGAETANVLSRLSPDPVVHSGRGAVLSPFVKATWMDRFRFLPRSRLLLFSGIVSSGIDDELHRGAYSVWTALTIISTQCTPSGSRGRHEAIKHFKQLLLDLRAELQTPHQCKPFHDAFVGSVKNHVGSTAIDLALSQIENEITERDVFASASYFSRAR